MAHCLFDHWINPTPVLGDFVIRFRLLDRDEEALNRDSMPGS